MRWTISSIIWIMVSVVGFSQQSGLSIGQWRSVLPNKTGYSIVGSDRYVFYATEQALLQIDLEDNSPRFFSRVEGLSLSGIQQLAYSQSLDLLILGYQGGGIDIMTSSGIQFVPDIINNLSITGDKSIYDIELLGDTIAVFSCGFGVAQFNLKTRLFIRTVFTPSRAYKTILHNEFYYMVTEDGIYRLPQNGFFQNFSSWERLAEGQGLPISYSANTIASVNGHLYVGINDEIWSNESGLFTPLHIPGNTRLRSLTSSRDHLVACFAPMDGNAGSIFILTPTGQSIPISGSCVGRPSKGIFDKDLRLRIADDWGDFRSMNMYGGDCERLNYNSLFHFSVSDIQLLEDTVYIASGTVASNLSGTANGAGIYVNRAGIWKNYNFFSYPELAQWQAHIDFNVVNVDPLDGTIYAGSYYGGLLKIQGESLTIFQDHNSTLQGAIGDAQRERVAGLARDQKGHLWISNSSSPTPIAVLTAQGEWRNFSILPGAYTLKNMVDLNNNKWFILGNNLGVLVYNEGADVLDPSDDKWRIFDSGNGNLPSNQIRSIAVDLDGSVWIGTGDGVGVVRCADPFNNSTCRASRVIVTQEGVPEALLNDEAVTAIAIDGANRKWLGTNNGLFVQSPDGLTEVARFTFQNSPLPDPQIRALAFNDRTGEMWIGTEKGIVVYQTDATGGGKVHSETVEVYPNPVRPDYRGPVAIKGLPRNANVKITDIRGRLVFETTALGGQAIWYGKDYTGRRAASGVYLVFSTSADSLTSPDTAVAKIVFVN